MPGCCLCTVSPKTWLSLHKPFMTRRQLSPPSRLVHNPLPIVPTQIVQLLDMADSSRSRRRLGSWPWFDESLKLPPPQRQGQGPVILAPWLLDTIARNRKNPTGLTARLSACRPSGSPHLELRAWRRKPKPVTRPGRAPL